MFTQIFFLNLVNEVIKLILKVKKAMKIQISFYKICNIACL